MKLFRILLGTLLTVTALVIVLYVVMVSGTPKQPEVRALWVTRFDYTSAQDVRSIIQNTAESGFTDVFFQIRGNGSAFYKSSVEPWAYELSGNDVSLLGTDPEWDPLEVAITAAKPLGLRLHAYLNVMPGWKGNDAPPPEVNQLWTAHPDWFMVDSFGDKMLPTSGWYSFLNPVVPEVRAHLRQVVSELCRYDVHGIHLDYIRYPYDYHLVADQHYPDADKKELMRRADFSYDPISQGALHDKYGWNVTQKEIRQFRCESITRVVRDISYVMQTEKTGACVLSASVMGDPVSGKKNAYQDSGLWIRQGLIDWAIQMNYGTKSFNPHLKAIRKAAGRKGFSSAVVVGLYCKNDAEEVLQQIKEVRSVGSRGWALFSYTFLFDENHQITEKGRIILPAIRP